MGGQILTKGRVYRSWQGNCRASLDWTRGRLSPHEHLGKLTVSDSPINAVTKSS